MLRLLRTLTLTIALLAGAVPLLAQTVPPAGKEQVDKLIAVLKSDAPQKEKVDACRGLAVIGTKEAVPALAALLGDEKLSHMARYGLEPIPDPSVDDALRDALGKLKGRPLAGVIVSIGARRDAKAVEPLAGMLQNPDADVVQAAARALGRIGTGDAAKALAGALPGAPAANQPALCEGLLRAAEALAAKGQRNDAIAIYDRLRSLQPAPHQVRTAALRGAILTRGQDGLSLLQEHLQSKDYLPFAAAVRTSQEIRGPAVTKALADAVPASPADNQVLLLQALGSRREPSATQAVLAAAKAGEKRVRLAAVRAAVEIGHPSALPSLLALAKDSDGDISRAAQEALAALPGQQVDAAVVELLATGQSEQRLLALELIGQRRITSAAPMLVRVASDPDASVRAAAIKRLGDLAGPAQMPGLVALLMRPKSPDDLGVIEQALSTAAARADRPDRYAEGLAATMARAEPAQKSALVRVLGAVGGARALKAVRDAMKDPSAEVRAAAIRTLSAWKTADVVPDLLALARRSSIPAEKTLGLRGYLAWASREELPAGERLSICREAGQLVQTTEEKNLLLAALGSIPSLDSLGLVMPHLDDAATRDSAGAAAVSVAQRLLKGKAPAEVASKLVEPLKKVIAAASDADLKDRAKAALQQAQRRAGRK